MTSITTIDPATGSALDTYAHATDAEVETALAAAESGFASWRRTTFAERASALRAFARAITDAREEAAQLITAEMGKPITQARAEVDKSALVLEYYADRGAEFLRAESVETGFDASYVQFAPLGSVLAIMPWNYPFWQVMRFVAPALMGGNTIVLKHASNVSGCALLLGDLARRAGLPSSLLQPLILPAGRVEGLIADRRIAAVTLTGSDAVGMAVGAACGRYLKKSVLELGGSDPFIVLADADVAAAARTAATARFLNNGQSCIAAKRFIVEDSAFDQFESGFIAAASALVFGDPTDDATDVGPMARVDLRDELADQVRRAGAAGGRIALGGTVPDGPGAFYPPTLVSDVAPRTPVFDEETFGPAAALVRARDASHAIRLANDSPYGLSSSLWSSDIERARSLAGDIEAGAVFINAMSASDPRMPFGGVKRSGWGRELGSFGIREFVNVQAVSVRVT